MTAIPPSGPYCPDNCMCYPFPDILLYYPRDYYWMYLAIFQLFAFVIFIVTNHYIVNAAKKLYTFLSISFALISSTVLLIAYFTQFSVVPISVMKGETDGIALITQYNEHGLFIAMEELGYMLMCLSLFSLIPVFSKNKRCLPIKLTIFIASLLAMISFLMITLIHGLNKQDRFEIAIITIVWFTLIIVGFLLNRIFSSEEKCLTTAST